MSLIDTSQINRQAMLSQMPGATAGDYGAPSDGGAAPPVRDLGENSPEAIAKLNAEHPEYSGGQALAPAPTAPDYTKLGKYSGQMGAWSEADPTKPANEKF